MPYTKKYKRPYEEFKDRPDKSTPVYASQLNMEADTFEAIEEYLANGIPASDMTTDDNHLFVTQDEKKKWNEGGGTVKYVNNMPPDAQGNLFLSAADVNALPKSTQLKDLQQDADHRTVTFSQIESWVDKYNKPESGIPEDDLSAEVKEKLNSGGGGGGEVISVNGKKGIVVLSASDVGAISEDDLSETTYDAETETVIIGNQVVTEAPSPLPQYSTEEQIVGLWIDGVTPVYKKMFVITEQVNYNAYRTMTTTELDGYTYSVFKAILNAMIVRTDVNPLCCPAIVFVDSNQVKLRTVQDSAGIKEGATNYLIMTYLKN